MSLFTKLPNLFVFYRIEQYMSHVLAVMLFVFLIGCGGSSADIKKQEINQAPIIIIATSFDVNENDNLSLSAQISDQDGQVTNINWQQLSGVGVALSTTSEATTSFLAPEVETDSQLVFEVTATDNDGDISSAQVTVNVQDVTTSIQTFTIGGNISGLNGLVEVSLNSEEQLSISQNGEFVFTTELELNQDYLITIAIPPPGQNCEVSNASGIIINNISNVMVNCTDTLIAQCNDGIDNDLDGLVDWSGDLGCSSQGDNSEGGKENHTLESGWSLFEPSQDTIIYYVSSSEGDDLNDGLSPNEPFQTYSMAISQARDNHPDWILLKRGDEFEESIQVNSGRSSEEPFLVSSYGDSIQRPLLKVGSNDGVIFDSAFAYIAIIGLDFYAHTRNPQDTDYIDSSGGYGFRIWRAEGLAGNDVLIENCAFRYFVVSVSQGQVAPENISIRRNIFEYNYSSNSHSQGIFSRGTVNFVFEENIMDHNGWLIQSFDDQQTEGQATKFNHNTYFNSIDGLVYQGNALMRGASMGSKFTAETQASNLMIENNLYLDNEIGVGMGQNYDHAYRFDSISISGNLFTHLGQSRPTDRSLGWAVQLDGLADSDIHENLILSSSNELVQNTFAFELFPTMRNVDLDRNVVHGIAGSNNRGLIRLYGDASQQNISLSNNRITSPINQRVLIETDESSLFNFNFSANHYFSNRAEESWFELANVDIDYTSWISQTGEQTASNLMPNYCDDSRTIESYQESLGAEPSKEGFISNIKQQGKFHWRTEYEVNTVNQWIKDGFTICP